jgi:gamma-glutamyltranspeptidase
MPGGRMIVTVTAQLAVNLIDLKATPRQAVSAPRMHAEGQEPIQVNFDMPPEVIEELRQRGHSVEFLQPLGGDANAVVIDSMTGYVQAAASEGSTGVLVF